MAWHGMADQRGRDNVQCRAASSYTLRVAQGQKRTHWKLMIFELGISPCSHPFDCAVVQLGEGHISDTVMVTTSGHGPVDC